MHIKSYIKDHIMQIVTVVCLIIFCRAMLVAFKAHRYIQTAIPMCILAVFIILFVVNYIKKKRFYDYVFSNLENIDKKYLIQELIGKSNFLEARLLKDILDVSNKSMLEEVSKYQRETKEYKEYIELWVHEIKTPIATSQMIIENNKNEVTQNIDEELEKIDSYVEQVLYYSRSNHVEKDYMIRKVDLEQIVKGILFKNKKDIINKKIKVTIEDIKRQVYSDSKWLEFIINQITINAIKYNNAKSPKINIYIEEGQNKAALCIKDNGIGIDLKDQVKLFQKGFTGNNGRINKKATGMGIYLCKKLCDKLGHELIIESEKDKGTIVKIIFPYNHRLEEVR